MNTEDDFAKLSELLKSQNEWLIVHSSGKSFALQKNEIELELKLNKILLSFLTDKGFKTWRVASFEQKGDEILLNLTRNFQKEREKMRLVPRISARELTESVELSRLEKANEIARLIIAGTASAKLVRVALNEENGRFAQIIFEIGNKQTAALADVSGAATHENLTAFAILWLAKLQNRKKNPVETVWILADKKHAKNLQRLHALLRPNWKGKIEIFEVLSKNSDAQNQSLQKLEAKSLENLWRERPKAIQSLETTEISRTAREIINLAPEMIDAVLAKQGETLRFFGLPFARIRRISGEEKVWFGTENKRQLLTKNNLAEFSDLIEELKIYRKFNSANRRHAFYRLAPEAWLEAILRRNVKLLDANLILSPIHQQFRAERDKIDLLALRRDGRLIVIELKAAPDREVVFQAADYWRKIELQRQAGNLQTSKIFGDLEISNQPALVYLVAPFLSFHRDFNFLSQTVAKEIEIFRFDLNENWREDLKVLGRKKV